jgi:plasmid stability protein
MCSSRLKRIIPAKKLPGNRRHHRRRLDDKVDAALKAKAELHGHSLEQELRAILSGAAKLNVDERLALADRIRTMTPKRRQTDSTVLIRQGRDR